MRNHTPGHPQHITLALVVADGLREETVYNKRPLEAMLCPPGGRAGRAALHEPGLSLRLAQCTTAASYEPVGGQQRADIIAGAGPGQRVGEASEIGQARNQGAHQGKQKPTPKLSAPG